MQKGSLFMFAGIPLLLAGVVLLKWTGLNVWWALIVLGAVMGTSGGIQVSSNMK